MEDSTVTLFVGLAGIVGTLGSAFVGHYYAAKARKSAYQEQLFSEQLSIIKRVHVELGNLKDVIPLMLDAKYPGLAQVESEAKQYISNLLELNKEASAILPSELWVDLNQLGKEACNFYAKSAEERSQEDIQSIAGITGLLTISSRRLLDEAAMRQKTQYIQTSIISIPNPG